MLFDILETDIKNRLISKLGDSYEVEILPGKNSYFNRPILKPRVTVAYSSSEFEKPKSTHEIVQQENTIIELMLQSRALRGDNGVFELLDKVRKAIIGFRPTHYGKIYAISFKLEKFDENLFAYFFMIGCRSELVEEQHDETEYSNITQVGFENQDPNLE